MEIKILSFSELTNTQLYAVLRLRAEVFVVEQDCVYLDMDNLDQDAIHLLGYTGDELAGYARIIKPGNYYDDVSIGRVVSDPDRRGEGLGKLIFDAAIQTCRRAYPGEPIRIMAQCYLTRFYEEFRFEIAGEEFLEDGIPHVEMVLR